MQATITIGAVQRLREASWLDLLKCAYFIFLASFCIELAVSSEIRREFVRTATFALIMMLIVGKDIVHAPEAFARLRAARAARQGIPRQLGTLLPPGLLGWFRLEPEMWRGCWAWIRRQPNAAPRPAGLRLDYLQQGSYSAAAGIVLVSIFGELPVSHILASLLIADPALEWKVHVMLLLGSTYSLIWVAGDRWHVASGYHVLSEKELDLKVGARAAAQIPLSRIAGAACVNESRAHWCRSNGVNIRDTAVISPVDRPNVVLTIAPGTPLPLSLFGREDTAPRYVFLYLDRPELLLAGLASALEES